MADITRTLSKRIICFGDQSSPISHRIIGAVFEWCQIDQRISVVGCVITGPRLRIKQAVKERIWRLLQAVGLFSRSEKVVSSQPLSAKGDVAPFHMEARKRCIPVLWAARREGVNTGRSRRWISDLAPDAILVLGCPQILRKELLAIPRIGAINYHNSYLPKYAGWSAGFWPMLYGENETGNTFHFINEGVDAGDIVWQESVPIFPVDSPGELQKRQIDSAVLSVRRVLGMLAECRIERKPQRSEERVYRSSKDLQKMRTICWAIPASAIVRLAQLFGDVGLFAFLPGNRRIRLQDIHLVAGNPGSGTPPGTIVTIAGKSIICVASGGLLSIGRVTWVPVPFEVPVRRLRQSQLLLGRELDNRLDAPLLGRPSTGRQTNTFN